MSERGGGGGPGPEQSFSPEAKAFRASLKVLAPDGEPMPPAEDVADLKAMHKKIRERRLAQEGEQVIIPKEVVVPKPVVRAARRFDRLPEPMSDAERRKRELLHDLLALNGEIRLAHEAVGQGIGADYAALFSKHKALEKGRAEEKMKTLVTRRLKLLAELNSNKLSEQQTTNSDYNMPDRSVPMPDHWKDLRLDYWTEEARKDADALVDLELKLDQESWNRKPPEDTRGSRQNKGTQLLVDGKIRSQISRMKEVRVFVEHHNEEIRTALANLRAVNAQIEVMNRQLVAGRGLMSGFRRLLSSDKRVEYQNAARTMAELIANRTRLVGEIERMNASGEEHDREEPQFGHLWKRKTYGRETGGDASSRLDFWSEVADNEAIAVVEADMATSINNEREVRPRSVSTRQKKISE